MGESKDQILEKAFELGKKYEQECTGCAQTTIAGIFDALGIWNEDVFKAASGLADGLGLTGDGSCGSLVGASMVIGYLFGRSKKHFKSIGKPIKSYELVKELHDKFIEKYGTCRCYDIQKSLTGRTYNLWDQKELQEAFADGAMIEKCSDLVGNVARMATAIILENGFNIKK
ncbi:MAG: C_GCAxxG_C_C family protein [Promethearchaeota archaeon]|nr:MAG: C_GCAxxG_C_C family protein [Candidatus Lokiarchaeota archaeon]